MTRNKKKDVSVFVGMVLTLALCVLSFILLDDLHQFRDDIYSDTTSSSIMLSDLISPGESESFYEYKKEFEARSTWVDLSFALSLLSLAITVLIMLPGRVTREGLFGNGHE